MDMYELLIRKRELELRLSIAIAHDIERFVQDTGVRVNAIEIPIQEVYEIGTMQPHHFISVEVGLDI